MDLNPAQLEAVTTLSGPLLVLAGAGTGKTRVVTFRIAELVRRRIAPDRILAVTFTNKAADEMQARATGLLGKRLPHRPEISTFHSLCVRILRRHADRLGYPKSFAICDRGDQESVARSVLREIKAGEALLRPGELIHLIGCWKTAAMSPGQAAAAAQTDREHLAAAGYRRYQKALKAAGSLDFDDLLLAVEELFRSFPDTRRQEAARFDHVMIDEYQDTNRSQYRITKALAADHRNLCVVGDDDQSIYGWRGAEVAHILRFGQDWPDAKIIRLETNYRSTHQILACANRLIDFNTLRHQKVLRATVQGQPPRVLQLPGEEAEAKAVVEEIQSRIQAAGRRPRDFAILVRTNEQPRLFEVELRRLKLPYVLVGGQSFYDHKEVRDILAYLKVLANPHDEVSLLRVINTPPRGIGQATITRLLEFAVAHGRPVWEVLSQVDEHPGAAASGADRPVPHAASGGPLPFSLPPGAIRAIAGFRSLVDKYREAGRRQPLADLVRSLIDQIGYRQELARVCPTASQQQARWATVEQIVNAAADYAQRVRTPSLDGFLREFALSSHDDDRGKDPQLPRDAVALMTLHAAKGLEFSEVYLVGMEEGLLPHGRSIEADAAAIDEERRLCYVGITRARRRLTFSLALARRKWGKARPTVASRFLYELTGRTDHPNYRKRVQGSGVRGQGSGNIG
jgi:DNA helicase-2/ATP-dependent DNA helicase PcrA